LRCVSDTATIEFGANATGGLAPYSYNWNFGDGSNSTDTGSKVLYTFDEPGNYTVTLGATDSGTPSQSASTTTLVTISPTENETTLALSNADLPYENSTSLIPTNATTDMSSTASILGTNGTNSSSAILTGRNFLSNEQNMSQIQLSSTEESTNSARKNVPINSRNSSNVEVTHDAAVAGDQLVTPATNETASVVLRGSDQDDDSTSDPSKRYLTVSPVQPEKQSTPIASDVGVATTSNHPVAITLTANTEQNTNSLKFSIATNPSHGKLSKLTNMDQQSASVTYNPDEGYSGKDIFEFKVDDLSTGSSTSGKVSIMVVAEPPNENPSPVTNENTENDQNNKMSSPETNIVDTDSVSRGVLSSEPSNQPSQVDKRLHDESARVPTRSDNIINHDPKVFAGQDLTINEGSSDVTLKGAAKDSDGDRLSYSWEQIAGEPVVVLVDANTAKPRFDAPDVDGDKVLTLRLNVADGNGGQATDSVRIIIKDNPAVERQAGQYNSDNLINHEVYAGQDLTVNEHTRSSRVIDQPSTSRH
jgi:PKD repeat protein